MQVVGMNPRGWEKRSAGDLMSLQPEKRDPASGVSFENTDPVDFLLAGFEGKEKTICMFLADTGKTALQ
jgi:hypothetical protein